MAKNKDDWNFFVKVIFDWETPEFWVPLFQKARNLMYSTETFEVLKLCIYIIRCDFNCIQPKHLKYWNTGEIWQDGIYLLIQPKHLKYWNGIFFHSFYSIKYIQPKHLKYWNKSTLNLSKMSLFNSTETFEVLKQGFQGEFSKIFQNSTETFEVLKLFFINFFFFSFIYSTETFEVLKQYFNKSFCSFYTIQPKHLKYWNSIKIFP